MDEAVKLYLAGAGLARRTQRVYGGSLTRWVASWPPHTFLDELNELDATGQPIAPATIARWFEERYGDRSPRTWNRERATLAGASAWWRSQGWLTVDLATAIKRRRPAPDRTRALSEPEMDAVASREAPLREKVLVLMLYETAARIEELLGLNIEDLDLAKKRARVVRKAGAVEYVFWQTRVARLLPRLIGKRERGPLFVTERKARLPMAAGDLDPATGQARLSYRRAAELLGKYFGIRAHQLKHSKINHELDHGTDLSLIAAMTGNSVRTLTDYYVHANPERVRRHVEATDPARRRP